MRTLIGKTAIVTGANRGIGRSIALKLAAEGASVVLTARNKTLLEQVSDEIAALGSSSVFYAADLAQEETAAVLVDIALTELGTIDIVINNAGATKRGDFLELTPADWQDGFGLKFFGTVNLTRAAWPTLKASAGSIVNIVGVGGRTPGADFAIGGSVNGALLSLTKALADCGVRDGIQVNAVNPGFVRTDRLTARLSKIALDRQVTLEEAEAIVIEESKVSQLGNPEDIAALTAFIVSPAGRLLHGALIDMDGGQTKTQ